MRVITIDKEETLLHNVDCGGIFKYNNEYYMKLRYESTEDLPKYRNCASPTVVCLEDGSLAYFAETLHVEVVDAELRVKE